MLFVDILFFGVVVFVLIFFLKGEEVIGGVMCYGIIGGMYVRVLFRV